MKRAEVTKTFRTLRTIRVQEWDALRTTTIASVRTTRTRNYSQEGAR